MRPPAFRPRLDLAFALALAVAACSPAGPGAPLASSPGASSAPAIAATSEPPSGLPGAEPEIDVVEGLTYATIDAAGEAVDLALDLYLPSSDEVVPAVVFVHGGAWFLGSREDCPGHALAQHGYAVACIDYRLVEVDGCPAWSTFPGAALDLRAAVDWLRGEAAEVGVDPDRIALAGDSSGAHLALLVALSSDVPDLGGGTPSSPWPSVQAVVDWFAPVDIRAATVAFTENPCITPRQVLEERHGDADGFLATLGWGLFLGGSLADGDVLERARAASPAEHVDPDDPPVLIVHGERDLLVPISQSTLLAERLDDAGVPVTLVRVPAAEHSFAPDDGDEGEIAAAFLDPTLAFLAQALAPAGG